MALLWREVANFSERTYQLLRAFESAHTDPRDDVRLNGYADNRRSKFEFANEEEIRTAFNNLVGVFEQKIYRAYPSLQADAGFQASAEKAVLLSLSWNSKDGSRSLLGSGLGEAIATGNRAAAWFEIRYGSNSSKQAATLREGLAKRRFVEAEFFGLYQIPGSATLQKGFHEAARER
jgi:hypothetical protein